MQGRAHTRFKSFRGVLEWQSGRQSVHVRCARPIVLGGVRAGVGARSAAVGGAAVLAAGV
jgi:hypothetical protein